MCLPAKTIQPFLRPPLSVDSVLLLTRHGVEAELYLPDQWGGGDATESEKLFKHCTPQLQKCRPLRRSVHPLWFRIIISLVSMEFIQSCSTGSSRISPLPFDDSQELFLEIWKRNYIRSQRVWSGTYAFIQERLHYSVHAAPFHLNATVPVQRFKIVITNSRSGMTRWANERSGLFLDNLVPCRPRCIRTISCELCHEVWPVQTKPHLLASLKRMNKQGKKCVY